jgi:glycosyltransferase involved in cell wall biosynthesis
VRLALAITTYDRPDALAAVLASVARQRVAPAQVVVADDGSGAATRELIGRFIANAATPAHHVVQPHEGFRLARLRNLAIAFTDCDYIVFVDGDMVLHPEFIADHTRLARRGFYTQGVRVLTAPRLTRELLADPLRLPGILGTGLGVLRRAYLLRSTPLSGLVRRVANAFIATKGCNQGFWRDDLVRVNGFDEDMVGWGPEDKELCARLEHAGVRRQTLLFGGIALHLHHAAASRAALPANRAVLEATLRERRIRCARGLDAHVPSGNMAPPNLEVEHAR